MRVEETILILGKVARAFFADERAGFGAFATGYVHLVNCPPAYRTSEAEFITKSNSLLSNQRQYMVCL